MKWDRLFRNAVRACFLTLLYAVWAPNASAKPAVIAEQKIEGWTLDAITDDSSDYAMCSIDRSNGHDMLLFGVMVERPSRVWSLTLSSLADDKPFKVGAGYSITYAIDGGMDITVRAEGLGTRTVGFPLSQDLKQSLRRGKKIELRASQGGAATFSLSGSARALDALQDCVDQYLGSQTTPEPPDQGTLSTSNPFEGSEAVPPAGTPADVDGLSDESLSEEILQTLKTTDSPAVESLWTGQIFLDEAHLSGYAESLDADSTHQLDGYDAIWKLPNAKMGFLVVDDVPVSSAKSYMLEVSGAAEKGCPTRSQTEWPDELAPGIVGRLRVYCDGDPSAMFIFLRRPRGGLYQVLVLGDPDANGRAAAENYDDKIARVLLNRASNP